MKTFKHHNFGFSYLEVMIAVALCAVLGGSLFTMQNKLFMQAGKIKEELEKEFIARHLAYVYQLQVVAQLREKKKIKDIEPLVKIINGKEYTAKISVIPEKSKLHGLPALCQLKIYSDELIRGQKNDKKLIYFAYIYNPSLLLEEPKEAHA